MRRINVIEPARQLAAAKALTAQNPGDQSVNSHSRFRALIPG
jgi:hypothetical protein